MSPWRGDSPTIRSVTVWRIVTITALSLSALALSLAAYLYASQRAGLIHSCEVSGNPLRQAVIALYEDQIAQTQHADLHQFFPSVPRHQLHHLIAQANQQRYERIYGLKHVPPCSERF